MTSSASYGTTFDVLIAGAGIIGLALALELRREGLSVAVVDRGRAMGEASWAAAGMLAAHDPENPPALAPLARLSLSLYPEFLAEVERLSGLLVPLRTSATLQGSRRRSPNALDARSLVSELVPGRWRFELLQEHSLDPRDLCAAVPAAARAAGVTLLEETSIKALSPGDETDRGLPFETAEGVRLSASLFVVCSGAWSGGPVTPRKGQALMVTLPREAPSLRYVVRTPELYLVPRGDGRILVGATLEDVGFDRSIDPAAIGALFSAGVALWPPLALGEIAETWSGLRPATPDGLPILGPLDLQQAGTPRRWIAAGHFRNGILLAPATARVMTRWILGTPDQGVAESSPFSPARFAKEAAPAGG